MWDSVCVCMCVHTRALRLAESRYCSLLLVLVTGSNLLPLPLLPAPPLLLLLLLRRQRRLLQSATAAAYSQTHTRTGNGVLLFSRICRRECRCNAECIAYYSWAFRADRPASMCNGYDLVWKCMMILLCTFDAAHNANLASCPNTNPPKYRLWRDGRNLRTSLRNNRGALVRYEMEMTLLAPFSNGCKRAGTCRCIGRRQLPTAKGPPHRVSVAKCRLHRGAGRGGEAGCR